MGANDREFSALDEILKKLCNGKISPQTAIKDAEAVLQLKQDYH